jgi:cell division protein FtsL
MQQQNTESQYAKQLKNRFRITFGAKIFIFLGTATWLTLFTYLIYESTKY